MCDVRLMLIKLVMFPYYWKFKLGGRGVAVGSCLRASGIGVSCIGKLNESVGAKQTTIMVDILVPRSTIVCSQRVGHNCRKTNLDKKSHIVVITHQQENNRSLDAALIQGNTRSGLQSTISTLTRTIGSNNNGNIKTKLREGTRTRAACLVSRRVSTAAGTQRTVGSFPSTPKLATKILAIAVKLAKENFRVQS